MFCSVVIRIECCLNITESKIAKVLARNIKPILLGGVLKFMTVCAKI